MTEAIGELALLNVGTGDTKISFDPKKPEEVIRASAVIKDMLKKGYAILIEAGKDEKGPLYRRAIDFDPKTQEYIIAGLPPEDTEPVTESYDAKTRKRLTKEPINVASKRGRRGTTRVKASTTRGVAVAPTAGG